MKLLTSALMLAAAVAQNSINIQVDNELTKECSDESDMHLLGYDAFNGNFTNITSFDKKTIPYAGHYTTFRATAVSTGATNVIMHWDAGCRGGTEDIEIILNDAHTNASVSQSWKASYGCKMRGSGSAMTYFITVCEADDDRDMCKGDGSCPLWPKPAL
jgi:hypothetical protein